MLSVKANYGNKKVEQSLRNSYAKAYTNPKFKALVNNLKIKESIAMKYTSRLEETVSELENCQVCKSLLECKNKIEGFINFPEIKTDRLVFSYRACKKMKKHIKDVELADDKSSAKATMKDIDVSDKKREKVIKWLDKFCTNYGKNKDLKGLYLHGSFGSGKSFLITAMLNELSKKRVKSETVYFPELIREFKGDFETLNQKLDYYMNVDLLLIDDIGAEKVTAWSRDEILGTILQSRMNSSLPTFFTSNLNLEELESHLIITSGSEDAVKARRIIERVKQLTENIEMISENRRK